MDRTLPIFPLFRDPVGAGVLEKSKARCDACGEARGWVYTGPVYSEAEDEPTVCPWCIADGTAADELGCTFNDATIYPMRPGVAQLPPEDAAMVEGRTPGFTTWQGNRWVMCCGSACVYLGEAQSGDLEEGGKWAAAAEAVMAEDGVARGEEERGEILGDVGDGVVAAYIFQCGTCGGLKGYWDAD